METFFHFNFKEYLFLVQSRANYISTSFTCSKLLDPAQPNYNITIMAIHLKVIDTSLVLHDDTALRALRIRPSWKLQRNVLSKSLYYCRTAIYLSNHIFTSFTFRSNISTFELNCEYYCLKINNILSFLKKLLSCITIMAGICLEMWVSSICNSWCLSNKSCIFLLLSYIYELLLSDLRIFCVYDFFEHKIYCLLIYLFMCSRCLYQQFSKQVAQAIKNT